MPRRYRSPTGRRKRKKQLVHQEAPAPEREPQARPVPQPALGASSQEQPAPRSAHILRDHSYVRAELKIIAVLALAILAGMVITAVFR